MFEKHPCTKLTNIKTEIKMNANHTDIQIIIQNYKTKFVKKKRN